jgi:spermidine/putrescine-binding protein
MKTVLALVLPCLLLSACGAPRQFSVLIHMMPEQEKYFREKIMPPFEKKNRCRVDVAAYSETGDLDKSIRALPGRCGLVNTPFEQTRRLVSENLVMPVDAASTPQQRTELQQRYFMLDQAMIDGKLYYFPRNFETRVMVYLKSRVREAVLRWGDRTDEIDSVLKIYNGSGLPAEYLLEDDPGRWDYYDLFVAGYFWSRDTPGKAAPKIVQGGRRCSGTAQTLVDRIYQLGGEKENVLSMEGDCVSDMLEWEALFVKEQIYHPAMWKDSLSGAGVWELFRKGEDRKSVV